MAIPVVIGIDKLAADYASILENRRVGLITNQAAVNAKLISTVDILYNAIGTQMTTLFAPEHGVRGVLPAGAEVADEVDPQTILPVYSLYGENREPTAAMLQKVEVLIIDLPDIGCRYWTYLSTLFYALRAAGRHQIPSIVLDRPNPITGSHVAGNILEKEFTSFVGIAQIPIRFGMTIGEMARLFNEVYDLKADLTVITMDNWQRTLWYDETGLSWVAPSPNMPSLTTPLVYPGTCLIEGTNLSEGRGTTQPFELVGAPWLDGWQLAQHLNTQELPGVRFRPASFIPTYSKHSNQLCHGIQVHVIHREEFQPVRTGLHILAAIKERSKGQFAWLEPTSGTDRPFIDLLAGTDTLRRDIDRERHPDEIWEQWQEELTPWLELRRKYLIY